MASIPQYAGTPKSGVVQISVANTNRDGTGTLSTVFIAGAAGSRIDNVIVKAVSTVTAGMVRLHLHDGVNARMLTEIAVHATTPSASVPTFEDGAILDIAIPAGYSLRASTHNAETFNVIAFGGDF